MLCSLVNLLRAVISFRGHLREDIENRATVRIPEGPPKHLPAGVPGDEHQCPSPEATESARPSSESLMSPRRQVRGVQPLPAQECSHKALLSPKKGERFPAATVRLAMRRIRCESECVTQFTFEPASHRCPLDSKGASQYKRVDPCGSVQLAGEAQRG